MSFIIIDFGCPNASKIYEIVKEYTNHAVHLLTYHKTCAIDFIENYNVIGIILSGGPDSVSNHNYTDIDPDIYDLHVPILGICYGAQLIIQYYGGHIESNHQSEFGIIALEHTVDDNNILKTHLIDGVYMSHWDTIMDPLPKDFVVTSRTNNAIASFESISLQRFGVQFHPEAHCISSNIVLKNFVQFCQEL